MYIIYIPTNKNKEVIMKTLTFNSSIHKLLFVNELCGQISDGMWENTRPFNHWEDWSDCEVVVGDNVGRDFHAVKDNYNLNSKLLLECVGDRMIGMVKIHLSLPFASDYACKYIGKYGVDEIIEYAKENDYWSKVLNKCLESASIEQFREAEKYDLYDMKDLKKDLAEMKKVMKIKK